MGGCSDEQSVRTDCSLLILRANFDCEHLFCISNKASFHMHFIDGPCVGAFHAGSELLNVLWSQICCFCYSIRAMLANVFFRFAASFRMHFTDGPRAALLVAGRAFVVGPRQNADSVLTFFLFW